jgi:hypothetical protein
MLNIAAKITNKLSEEDWENYSKVWNESNTRNPFISPEVLRSSYNQTKTLSIVYFYNGDKLIGAIPYTFIGGVLKIAGESMSDSIQFPFLPSISITQKYYAIKEALSKINPSNIEFKKLCTANTYLFLVIKAINERSYKAIFVKSWKNLFVRENASEEGNKSFRSIFNKSNTRNYSNKFRREHNYIIKVVDEFNEDELNNFLNYFFMYHEIRWNDTPTPSIYSRKELREELKRKVKGWLLEKSCVLFSLNVEDKPTSMAICLKTKNSIVYHQIAYSLNEIYLKYRINKLLIFELSKWMADNDLTILDFGVGEEPYKYEYTKNEDFLVRVYASKTKLSKTYIKGIIDYHYQKSPRLINFLNNKLRVNVSKKKLKINTVNKKLKYLLNEFKTDKKFISKKIKIATEPDTQYFYRFIPSKISFETKKDITFRIGEPYDIISFYEKEIVLTPAKRQYYLTIMAENKKTPYCLYTGSGEVASIAWVAEPHDYELPEKNELNNPHVIIDCFTAKQHRGKGYYAYLLNIISSKKETDSLIYTNDWNIASQRGIEKAGFEKIAIRVLKKGSGYEWQPVN